MAVMSTSELPPPTVEIVDESLIASGFMDDEAPDHQPTLSLTVAGTMEIPGSDDGARPPLLMLFMADGTVRWVKSPDGE
jgi:hypothetical protein